MYGGAPVRSDGGSGLPVMAKVLRLTCFAGETKASYWSKIMKNSSKKWSKESAAMAILVRCPWWPRRRDRLGRARWCTEVVGIASKR